MPKQELVQKKTRSMRVLEGRVYEAQYHWIIKHYGQSAADSANYGWGMEGNDKECSIATKVYGHGRLCTYASLKNQEPQHEFQEF